MNNVIFLGVTIVFDGEVDSSLINLGAVTLKNEGREYILDIIQSDWNFEDGQTTVECKIAEDRDTFEDCKYDLLMEDFYSPTLIAEVYVGTEEDGKEEFTPEHQTLFVKIGECTKAIDLTLE